MMMSSRRRLFLTILLGAAVLLMLMVPLVCLPAMISCPRCRGSGFTTMSMYATDTMGMPADPKPMRMICGLCKARGRITPYWFAANHLFGVEPRLTHDDLNRVAEEQFKNQPLKP